MVHYFIFFISKAPPPQYTICGGYSTSTEGGYRKGLLALDFCQPDLPVGATHSWILSFLKKYFLPKMPLHIYTRQIF